MKIEIAFGQPIYKVELNDAEVILLLEQYAPGDFHNPTNHGPCCDTACVSCKIVRTLKTLREDFRKR